MLPRLLGAALLLATAGTALAQPSACFEAERRIAEAGALRVQARQDANVGERGRVCTTLDEAGDRYDDAQDLFEECGRTVAAIGLRAAHRDIDGLKRFNACP